jgi:hypothetical protein
MTDEEKTREQIIDIVNNEEPVKEEIKEEVKEIVKEDVKEEIVKEEIKQEEIKPKAKRASRAKVKIIKESVVAEPVVEVVEEKPVEPVIEEKPKKVDRYKELVSCPDCHMKLTVHTLKYIHKRRGFCKAVVKADEPEQTPEPIVQPKTKITEDIVNDYIKQNPDIISNYLRNERAMKAQRKQMNARSLLNNAF